MRPEFQNVPSILEVLSDISLYIDNIMMHLVNFRNEYNTAKECPEPSVSNNNSQKCGKQYITEYDK